MPTGQVDRNLGGLEGFGELAFERSDDGAFRIDARSLFPEGLTYFGNHYSGEDLWIGTNGVVSFGSEFIEFPDSTKPFPVADFIAPFWADVDTRLDGEGQESGQIWGDLEIQEGQLTITWADVGSYRRQAELTNLFQLQLTNRGAGDFDISVVYERIDWTTGTLEWDAGAWVGLNGVRLPTPYIITETPADLAGATGNSGASGAWLFEMRDGTLPGNVVIGGETLVGDENGNILTGGAQDDIQRGYDGQDILRGNDGDDWLFGGDGADTLNGAAGNDVIRGGDSAMDLRDVVYGGDGDDDIDAGYGNDQIYGGDGDDTIEGGFGVDELIGQAGNDVLSGAAWSDLIFGGDGMDFLNGGFGFDRLNGGAGADRFFHLGIFDHGSDWVQDYSTDQGDVLVWGRGPATGADFQINFASKANAGTTQDAEAFVIYKQTGQIIWALIDGAAQESIVLMVAGTSYDLLL